jgi:APA family basic amino acid/polyamine antiporter
VIGPTVGQIDSLVVSSVRPVRPVRLVAFSEFHLTSTRPAGLRRALGGVFGLAIAIGATIGGGILGTPGDVAAALPSPVLYMLVWILGAGSALLGANILSELGAMMPSSGGLYVFGRRAFGDGVGFFIGYADWINWCIGPPALLLLAGDYLGVLFPALGGHASLVGLGLLGILGFLQWLGVRTGARTQEITSLLKTAALVALVGAAFLLPHSAPAVAVPVPLAAGWPLLLAFGVAMQGVIFTYDSYYAAVYCGGEITDPGRTIPRSMFRGLWIVIIIYLLLNTAFLTVVPIGAMAHDTFVGGTVARMIFGARGDVIIRLIMVVSILGTVNAQIMAAPRIILAMGEDGLFPRIATRVNKGGTPAIALAMSVGVMLGFFLLGSFSAVVRVAVVFSVVLYVASYTALFVLRRREPLTPRPYRAWGYPWLPILGLLIAAGLLVSIVLADYFAALVTGALLLLSWPASGVVRRALR